MPRQARIDAPGALHHVIIAFAGNKWWKDSGQHRFCWICTQACQWGLWKENTGDGQGHWFGCPDWCGCQLFWDQHRDHQRPKQAKRGLSGKVNCLLFGRAKIGDCWRAPCASIEHFRFSGEQIDQPRPSRSCFKNHCMRTARLKATKVYWKSSKLESNVNISPTSPPFRGQDFIYCATA